MRRTEIDGLRWYHTIDVAPGVTTPGMFDLRHALPLLPFPDLRGARCLDVGTWDGFYAFEMERRGAREVVALDVPDLSVLDYPPEVLAGRAREADLARSASAELAGGGQERSAGFRLLHRLLDSKVTWRAGNVYDLNPADFGVFDFVVVGSLLVHLRDPVRALDAVRSVVHGGLLSVDHLHTPLVLLSRRRPLFELRGESSDFQWWLAGDAGVRHLLGVGGFAVERTSRPFLLRPGATYRSRPRRVARWAANAALTGDWTPGGHLHRGYLSRPRF